MKVYIVSYNGIDECGGVERMTSYWLSFLPPGTLVVSRHEWPFRPLDALLRRLRLGTLSALVFAVWASFRIRLAPGRKFIISQGAFAPFLRADLLLGHGNMRAFRRAIHGRSRFGVGSVFEFLESAAARRARYLVPVSPRVGEEWIKGYGIDASRVRPLLNCVDTKRFHPAGEGASGARKALFVGRLEANKGLDCLLRFSRRLDAWELHLASPQATLPEEFRKEGVFFHPNPSPAELNRLYNACDVLLLPSVYEGFPLVVLEAMAAGCPVAATSVGGIDALLARKAPGVFEIGPACDGLREVLEAAVDFSRRPLERRRLSEWARANFSLDVYRQGARAILSEAGLSET